MGKIRWYKRDPNAALAGMANLTIEEKGAYNTVLDLIYAHDGAVDDDVRYLSGWMRCDVRVWKRIRARLIELGKIYVDAGQLRNSRADEEVDEGLHRVASVSEANRIKGIKSGVVRRKNKHLDEPRYEPPTNTTTTTEVEAAYARANEAAKISGEGLPPHWPAWKKICAAIGVEVSDPGWVGRNGRVAQWIANGWDIDLDCVPTIQRVVASRAKAGKTPARSLELFEDAIADARASRIAPLPKGTAGPGRGPPRITGGGGFGAILMEQHREQNADEPDDTQPEYHGPVAR